MYILRVTKGVHLNDFILMDDGHDEVDVLDEMKDGEVGGWSLHSRDATILDSLQDVQALRDYLESNRDLTCEIISIKAGI